ncbi:hypothetical protein M8Z33_27855 [Streptomyces sp. ZAF1911]|nr:hypothetical protein [Streptomyces sp. ZAF1911]MDD9380400.1 hypothetical protein [Streptomyces sp. ZAF1911]
MRCSFRAGRSHDGTALIWSFAGLWVVTALCLLRLTCRWGRKK